MTKKNQDERGRQKGAVERAEGQHGDKTHQALIDQLQSRRAAPDGAVDGAGRNVDHNEPGKHKLFEDREQHDEADKNAEKNRLALDVERHKHERDDFRVPGSREEPMTDTSSNKGKRGNAH